MLELNNFKLSPFYNLDDKGGSKAVETKQLSTEDTIDFLKDDEEKDEVIELKDEKKDEKEEKKDEEKDEEKDDKKDELEELEDELKEPKEEDLELIAPVATREILAKYPKLWKDFPHLRNSYYRERAYTEIVPTIDDAKEAVAKAQALDQFDSDLREGSIGKALQAVKKSGDDSFNKLVDNYLLDLHSVDKDAYLHVAGNIIKTTTNRMLKDAAASNNAELKAAAEILNEYIFRTKEIQEPTKLSSDKPKDDSVDKLKKEKEDFFKQKYDAANNDVSTRVKNTLKSTIEANIDPKKSMTDYVRKVAVKEAQEQVIEMLDKDTRLNILIDKLFDAASKSNFSRESLDKIKSAYLSRAKTLLPAVIKAKRNEALKGSSRKVTDETEEENEVTDTEKKETERLPVGKSTSSSNSGKTNEEKARAIPANVSSRDFLMQD